MLIDSVIQEMDADGRLLIPEHLRQLLGLQSGDQVVLHVLDGGIFLRPMPKVEE